MCLNPWAMTKCDTLICHPLYKADSITLFLSLSSQNMTFIHDLLKFEPNKAFEMGLDPNMQNMTLAKMELEKLVERFDVIVITEKIFESLVLIAQRK